VKPGAAQPEIEDIKRHCLAQLAPYKVPVDIRFLDILPRNATGKILKPELRQILKQG